MEKQLYKRRRLLIDAGQYRLLAFNLIYFFIILLVIAAVLFVPLMIQLDNRTLSLVEKQEVANHLLALHTLLWPALLILFLLLAAHSVLVSNRIWGALYRFRNVLKAVANGDFSVRVIIRKHDYLWKEADTINGMIAALGARIKSIEQQNGQLHTALVELKRASDTGSEREINQYIQSLGRQIEQLKVHLDAFKTTTDGIYPEGNIPGNLESKSTTAGPKTINHP